ncbi:MAG: hypothetical protein R3335_03560 [Anaerolineales bacterium]|nr:hypothetical protein [Anaerolineales bacterium]
MNYGNILKESFNVLWRLKFLWIFGFVLATTTPFAGGWWLLMGDGQGFDPGITFYFEDGREIRFMGEGIVVDFTEDGKPHIQTDDLSFAELRQLLSILEDINLADLWLIPVIAGIGLLLMFIIQAGLRYSSEAAVIHSVDEYNETGSRAGVIQAFRYGWSRTMLRLIGIDLLIYIGVVLFIGMAFFMALAPAALGGWSGNESIVTLSVLLTVALLFGWTFILAFVLLGSTLIRQVAWRACGTERLGVFASLQNSLRHIEADFPHLIPAWFIWIGAGLVWLLLLVPLLIVLFPILLLSLIGGLIAGFLPALLAWSIASLYLSEIPAIFLAVLVGLPIFILIAASPLFFLGGLVRIFQSNIWTLSYRALPAITLVSEEQAGAELGAAFIA